MVEILLVEDDDNDATLMRSRLAQVSPDHRVVVVGDGEAAIHYLRKEEPYADAETPDLVLLDLNLPRIGGHEVLAEVKSDASLRQVPIVVLSGSAQAEDIRNAYQLQANAYLVKPFDLSGYRRTAEAIRDFWLSLVRFPEY